MTAPRAALLVLALLATAGAGPAAGGPTLLDEVRAHLEAALGHVPATVLANGEEARTDAVLAPLLGVPLQPRQWAVPTRDVGVGYRVGPDPCAFAAVVVAEAWGNPPPDALQAVQTPGLVDLGEGLRCWGLPTSQRFVHGAATAEVAPGAQRWYACLPAGGFWLDQNPGCHEGDFRNVTLAGHVASLDILADSYHLEVLFCGVLDHSPDVAGDRDGCPVLLQREGPLELVGIEG